jgi:hypothetical protein
MMVAASASTLIVTVDLHARNTPVTLTAKDADVNDVLSALFNATDNTFQLQTGVGISGKIASLQLTQSPFDDAVKTILAQVNPAFTCTKEDGGVYSITNPANTADKTPVLQLFTPTLNDPDIVISTKLTLPVLPDKNAAKGGAAAGKGKKPAAAPADSLLSDDTPAGDATGKDDKPTTEECYLAMIKIRYQPVHVFAVGFGADELPDFSTLANPGGTSGSGSGGSGYNGMSSPYGNTNGINGNNGMYGNTNGMYGNTNGMYGNTNGIYGNTNGIYGNTGYGNTGYGNIYGNGGVTTTTTTGSSGGR